MRQEKRNGRLTSPSKTLQWTASASAVMVWAFSTGGLVLNAEEPRFTQASSSVQAQGDGESLPPGALARLGTLRWRHGDAITYVAFPPDGKSVLTAGQDNTIRLWERASGKELRRFTIPQTGQANVVQPGGVIRVGVGGRFGGVSSVALSTDGLTLAAVFPNNTIQLWDTSTGKELRQLKTPPTGAVAILFSPDGKMLAARGTDRSVTLFDPGTGKEIRQIKSKQPAAGVFVLGVQPGGEGTAIAFSADSKTLATSESIFENRKVTMSLKLTDVANGNVRQSLETAPANVSAVSFSGDGKFLAYASGNTVHLCAPDTGKEIRSFNVPGGASLLVFAPDSKTLAVKSRDKVVRLIEAETGKESRQLGEGIGGPGGNQIVFNNIGIFDARDVAFSPDGKVLGAGGGHAIIFWDTTTGKEVAGGSGGHRGPVSALAVSADGKTIASRGADNVIRRWDAATGKELGQFPAPAATTCAAFSDDLRFVALGVNDITIRIHDVATGKQIHQLKGHTNGTATLAFSPGGKVLASRGSFDQIIKLFDPIKGGELHQIALQGNPQGVGGVVWSGYGNVNGLALAFSPDGQTLAANVAANNPRVMPGGGAVPAGVGNTIRLWDVPTAKEIRQIPLPAQQIVVSLAYSPDGRVLGVENADQTVALLEIASGKERLLFGKPAAPAVGGGGGGMAGGAFIAVARTVAPSSVIAFSPDGGLLAGKGPANTVRVWDLRAGKEIAQLKGHEGAVATVAFARDGRSLVSGSADTTLLVWDATRLKREPIAATGEIQAKEVESRWIDLVSEDAGKAYRGILTLAASPQSAVAFLGKRLQPAVPVDAKKLDRWIADLDSTNFKTRSIAASELEKLGELALPALKKVMVSPPSVEARRRVEPIVEKLTGGTLTTEQVRIARAVEVLERANTAEARQVLEGLAQGAPGAFMTRQARLALDQLSRRAESSRP